MARNTSALMVAQLLSRVLGVFYLAALARYVGSAGLGIISTASVLNGCWC